MFLHFHKLTTELFHSIKTQQISLFNASVGSNANCLCHVLGAIKSAGLQSATLSNRGLCVAGQWFLWLRQLTKSLGRRRYCTCLPAVRSLSSCLCTGVRRGYLLTSVAVTVMLCHMSVSRSSALASVIFPSSTLILNCLSRSVCRSMKYLQRQQIFRNLSQNSFALLWVLWLTGPYPSRETSRLMHVGNQ